MKNSFVQKFFKAIFPKKLGDDMEAESRSWMMKCSNCNHERSVWEIGGIRWKAAGNPRVYRQCVNCNAKSWHTVYKITVPKNN